ncbi:hypothetical protein XaC1_520 [Xanthomonas phage XaC1]|nr:hypothetical protein XaC1_520 [Xanthomonas phage XaC1]
MISVVVSIDTIYNYRETFDFNHGIKIRSPKTDFYIGNMSIEDHPCFFIANPYKTSLNFDIKSGYISINDEKWIPYIFEDKNEFFQHQTMNNYYDLKFEHLVKLKELFEFLCKKLNYELE